MYICHWFPIYPQLLVVSPIVSTCVNIFTNLAIIFVMIVSSLPIFAVFVVTMFLFVGALLPGRAALLGCILGIPEQSAALLVAAGGRTGFSTCFQGPKKSGPCRFEVHEIDALQIDVLDDFEFDTLLIHVDIYLYILYCMYICLEHGSKVPPSGHRICWMGDRSRTILFDSMNILWVVLIMHSLFGGVSKFDPYAPIWKSCAWHVYVYVSRSIFQRIPDDW